MKPVLIAAVLSVAPAWAADPPVDLNQPGVLEALKVERPRHYEAVSEALAVAERLPCKDRDMQSCRQIRHPRDEVLRHDPHQLSAEAPAVLQLRWHAVCGPGHAQGDRGPCPARGGVEVAVVWAA